MFHASTLQFCRGKDAIRMGSVNTNPSAVISNATLLPPRCPKKAGSAELPRKMPALYMPGKTSSTLEAVYLGLLPKYFPKVNAAPAFMHCATWTKTLTCVSHRHLLLPTLPSPFLPMQLLRKAVIGQGEEGCVWQDTAIQSPTPYLELLLCHFFPPVWNRT